MSRPSSAARRALGCGRRAVLAECLWNKQALARPGPQLWQPAGMAAEVTAGLWCAAGLAPLTPRRQRCPPRRGSSSCGRGGDGRLGVRSAGLLWAACLPPRLPSQSASGPGPVESRAARVAHLSTVSCGSPANRSAPQADTSSVRLAVPAGACQRNTRSASVLASWSPSAGHSSWGMATAVLTCLQTARWQGRVGGAGRGGGLGQAAACGATHPPALPRPRLSPALPRASPQTRQSLWAQPTARRGSQKCPPQWPTRAAGAGGAVGGGAAADGAAAGTAPRWRRRVAAGGWEAGAGAPAASRRSRQ